MVVRGHVVNHPSDYHERGVTSSILILRGPAPAAPSANVPAGSSTGGVGATGWESAERDPGSTGGLLDALVRGAFGPALRLPPELRSIVRAYRAA